VGSTFTVKIQRRVTGCEGEKKRLTQAKIQRPGCRWAEPGALSPQELPRFSTIQAGIFAKLTPALLTDAAPAPQFA
jgi:hypothetical protein